MPFTRNDIYAINALKAQFLGQGGGDEANRTQFLTGLQKRIGKNKGKSVFNDLRQFKNEGARRPRSTGSSSTASLPDKTRATS